MTSIPSGFVSRRGLLLLALAAALFQAGCGGNASSNTGKNQDPPQIQFSANPSSINSGQSAVLTWATQNATSVSIDNGVGMVAASGTATVAPMASTTYTLTATGAGGSATAKASITVAAPGGAAPTASFSANPATVQAGQSSTLTWSTTNATSVTITPGIGPVAASGSKIVTPTSSTTYTLSAQGPGGTASATAAITVNAPASGMQQIQHVIYMLQENRSFDSYFGQLGAYRAQFGYGAATDIDGLQPTFSNTTEDGKIVIPSYHFATSCIENASPDWLESHASYNLRDPGSDVFMGDGFVKAAQGDAEYAGRVISTTGQQASKLPASGSIVIAPKKTTNYYLFADRSGVVLAQQTVYVNESFTATPPNLAPGGTSTLQWNIPNAVSVILWDSNKQKLGPFAGGLGSVQVTPASTDTYTLIATMADSTTANYSVVVTVNAPSGSTLTASSNSITLGQTVTLTWNVPGATSVLIDTFFDQEGRRAMGYYDATDLPYAYFMASNFATSDRWFSPLSSNSEPNRMYALAATTHGHVHDPGTFCSDASSCSNPSNVVKNIFQLLDAAGITWKVYYQQVDPKTGLPATRLNRFQPFAKDHAANIVPASQYFTDLQNGTLPQVAYIEENSGLDEHPGGTLSGNIHSGNNIQAGAQFVSTFINALMASSYWKSSVFFFTFDEGGGLYDHVSPQPAVSPDNISPMDLEQKDIDYIVPQGDFNRTGFRVPMIVISPFSRKSYVSHTVADYTAILTFIEKRFGLPSLTARDAAQIDMSEFFDWTNPPWMTPPTPPQQPVTEPCDYTHLQ